MSFKLNTIAGSHQLHVSFVKEQLSTGHPQETSRPKLTWEETQSSQDTANRPDLLFNAQNLIRGPDFTAGTHS